MSTTLQLNVPQLKELEKPERRVRTDTPAASTAGRKAAGAPPDAKILRFAKAERIVHWAIAGPFLVSFATAMILVFVYNPDPSRPFRSVFAVLHRVSGVALMVLPLLATFKRRGDMRIHFYNIRQAWTWMFDDFKWLALMGLAAVNSRIKLPEQGKFNAAEKLNFMVLMTTYPLYVATGVLMWVTHLAVLSWILHFLMAVLATPLLLGHLYMALINAGTRPGLEGMTSGFVDRHWAKHHYRRWYREHHEATEERPPEEKADEPCAAMASVQEDCAGSPVVSPRVACDGPGPSVDRDEARPKPERTRGAAGMFTRAEGSAIP